MPSVFGDAGSGGLAHLATCSGYRPILAATCFAPTVGAQDPDA